MTANLHLTRTQRLFPSSAIRFFTSQSDLFGRPGQAAAYRSFRPIFHPTLFDEIGRLTPNITNRMIDMCTGSGQVAYELAKEDGCLKGRKQVVGIDVSSEQLRTAKPHPNITYRQGSAEDLANENSSSVDLVTIGQGLHWIREREEFFKNVHRCLVPGGIFCTLVYQRPDVLDNERLNNAWHHLYYNLLGSSYDLGDPRSYWDVNRPDVDNSYKDYDFSPFIAQRVTVDNRVALTPEGVLGYIDSISAYQTYRQRNADLEDPKKVLKNLISEDGLENVTLNYRLRRDLAINVSCI